MAKLLNRREFLKLGPFSLAALSLGSLGFQSYFPQDHEEEFSTNLSGRVTTTQISVHRLPQDTGRIIRQRYRDEILRIYNTVTPETGPAWNPRWYRVWGGYVHSARVQLITKTHQNVIEDISPEGVLGEITVPYTQVLRFSQAYGWEPLYRLYFGSTHWVTGIRQGPDEKPWYQLFDELTRINYYAPAHHIRLLSNDELAPISPELPWGAKRIEVDLYRQNLTAFENDVPVLSCKVSTGVKSNNPANGIPTETPTGRFNISVKMPSKHMGEGRLTDNLEDYELVGVPWTSFFHEDGYAIHGTYWHDNYGVPMSRGCINMPNQKAKWLFRWVTPVYTPSDLDKRGYGTILDIFK